LIFAKCGGDLIDIYKVTNEKKTKWPQFFGLPSINEIYHLPILIITESATMTTAVIAITCGFASCYR